MLPVGAQARHDRAHEARGRRRDPAVEAHRRDAVAVHLQHAEHHRRLARVLRPEHHRRIGRVARHHAERKLRPALREVAEVGVAEGRRRARVPPYIGSRHVAGDAPGDISGSNDPSVAGRINRDIDHRFGSAVEVDRSVIGHDRGVIVDCGVEVITSGVEHLIRRRVELLRGIELRRAVFAAAR